MIPTVRRCAVDLLFVLKAGSHIIAPVVSIAAITSKVVLRSGRSSENITQTIVNARGDWGDRSRLDRPCSIRRLAADRGDRKRFYENYFYAGRRSKRSKLSHTGSILFRTEHGLTTNMVAKTAEFDQGLFMEEVQKYDCIYDKFWKDYKNKYIRLNSRSSCTSVWYACKLF